MKAKNLELLAFPSVSWSGACRLISGLSLSFMGVPLATSATCQATSTKAAELDSVRMACTQAIRTKSLLQNLQLDQPMSLRVLTGGHLAEQLGLSRKTRHLDLWSWFGQFQLSRVPPQQNLAASLTNNLTASGLHRLLPKLRMHTRSADALALSTELGVGPAFFRSSSSSFFIGVLSKAPAMAQLTARDPAAAYCKTSLQKELEAAYCEETSFQHKELEAAYPANRGWRAFIDYLLGQTKARELELSLAQLCKPFFATKSLQQNELAAAYCNKTLPAFPGYLLGQTKARELQLNIAQLCKQDFAHQSFKRNELVAAYLANQGLTAYLDHLLGQTKARELELTIAQLCEHQFAQPSFQKTELLGKEFGTNIIFKELLGAEMAEHLTVPKLERKELEKHLVVPTCTRASSSVLTATLLSIFMSILIVSSFLSSNFPSSFIIDNFMTKSFGEKELAEHHNFHKWLRELENACKYKEKFQLCNFELVTKFVIILIFKNGIAKRQTWTMSLQRTLRMRT